MIHLIQILLQNRKYYIDYYLLYIHQIIAPVQQPFESVKGEIAKQVFNLKVKESIERWADQLSKYYPVKIFESALAQLK